MPPTVVQIPSIILPQVWATGAEVELTQDLLTHPSLDVYTEYLHEKIVHITATEVVAAGVPGNLQCWIEVSPIPFATSDIYYCAIGGGGGPIDPATGLPYIAPVAPVIEVPLGVLGTVHSIILPWAIHSAYARLVVQTPVAATPLTDYWAVQAMISAKTP